MFSIIPTNGVPLSVLDDDTIKPVNIIGPWASMGLNLDQPSVNARAIKSCQTQLVDDTQEDAHVQSVETDLHLAETHM